MKKVYLFCSAGSSFIPSPPFLMASRNAEQEFKKAQSLISGPH